MGRSKVILPKKLSVDPAAMARVITNTMNSTALAIRTDFAVTVQTWKDKPLFAIRSPSRWTREISTDDAIYGMLNAGTPAHEIAPKPGKVLAFRTPFRSKTLPRQIVGRAGATGAAQVFTRRSIHHPGTEPRQWDSVIAEKWQKQFPILMQRAIDAEVR